MSRLLEYAAAMSAAQEKVTGSSRLDMAGIMAALAMAKTRGDAGDTRVNGDIGVKTQAPQTSFLHNKFKQAEEVKPVHIPISVEKNEKKEVKKEHEEREQVVRAERVTVKDEEQMTMTSSWTSEKRSESARSSFSSAKSVFSSDNSNASVKSSLPPIKIGISNNNNNVNNNYENVQVDSPKPALPPRNPIWANKNNVDNAKDSVICNPKPSSVMNARSHSGILTKSSLDNMSREMKVQERDSDDDNKKHQVPALKSSLGVAKFIRQANISGSEETVQQTKYQSENMAQHATKPVAEAKRIFEQNAKSLKEEARLPRGGSQTSDDSEALQGSPETMSKFLKIVEKLSETKEKETGNGRLEMTELMAALNHFQTSDIKDTSSAVTKPQVTLAAPPLPISAPPPPPPLSSPPHSPPLKLTPGGGRQGKEVTPHAMSDSVEQSGNTFLADNAKSSFLKSTLSHTTSVFEGNSTNKTQQQNKTLFTEEKSSLLGELKSRLNGETDFQEAETRSRPIAVTNPDQLVNKMVYNQYRGMLNSYKHNK